MQAAVETEAALGETDEASAETGAAEDEEETEAALALSSVGSSGSPGPPVSPGSPCIFFVHPYHSFKEKGSADDRGPRGSVAILANATGHCVHLSLCEFLCLQDGSHR